ncbi:class III lanthionine synthetase LanKC [Corallococcus exercitus]|uniref:class III lanthionine synthetase LanKC n=1 Tax=Corallococcus exercitus TaxID=2316736 RepID=UPI0035D4919E
MNFNRFVYNFYWFVNREVFEQWTYYRPSDAFFRRIRALLPPRWSVRRKSIWVHVNPPEKKLPAQGWKIHISATPSNCEQILERVARVCIERGTSFKFLLDEDLLVRTSHKGWSREASGKFMALYPRDDADFRELIEACHVALKGFSGPYVLSDRRYKDAGAVYYRYGGISGLSELTPGGEHSMVLVDPQGKHQPDLRKPYWSPPDWVTDPFPAEEKGGAEDESGLLGGKYDVENALAFSATGGVYLGKAPSGAKVIIKEARPLTGYDNRESDAVARLHKEFRILQKLQPAGIAPTPVEIFQEWEHAFLVEEFIEGSNLAVHILHNNPLIKLNSGQEFRRDYLSSLKRIWINLAEVLASMHDAGVVGGDISLTNILVSDPEQGKVRLIDLEAAWEEGKDFPIQLTTTGFSPKRKEGVPASKEDDYYALGALMLATLFPMNSLLGLDPTAKDRFLEEMRKDLGVPRPLTELIRQCMSDEREARPSPRKVAALLGDLPEVGELEPHPPPDRDALLAMAVSSMDHALASADYSRDDRLFPADPHVFGTNPLNVAFGACGVALALNRIKGEVPGAVRSWILSKPLHPDSYPPGLYVGAAGIAWTLWEMGVDDVARRVLRDAGEHPLLFREANVYQGASGYGLACLRLYLGSKEQEWLDQAVRVGEWLLQQKQENERQEYSWADQDGKTWLGHPRGASGIGLFLLYLGLAANEPRFVKAGRQALAFDLSFAMEVDGVLSIPRGPVGDFEKVVTHYWLNGSAGVGLSLARFWKHTQEPELLALMKRFAEDCTRKYVAFPGLFQGLSGLGNFLLDLHEFTGEERYLQDAHKTARGATLYGVKRSTGVAFPGHQLMRTCTDFATGSAGVALFLHRLAKADEKPGDFNFTLDALLATPARR